MSETELIASVLQGDGRAFTGLVSAYQAAVYNLCYRMLGNPGDAEDAAQEAFLRAFAQLQRYDPARPFKTWLLAIASHLCIDRLRRRRLCWVSIDDDALAAHPALRERAAGPEEMALRHEKRDQIATLLAGLAPDSRGAVIMRYWYDLSYEEIAAATGTTVSAVKSRLHRARLSLGQRLQAGPGPDDLRRAPSYLAPAVPPGLSA